jgi:hypothetical protein
MADVVQDRRADDGPAGTGTTARVPLDKGIWLAVATVTLAGVVPLLFIVSSARSAESSTAWGWAWLLTVLVGFRLAWLIAVDARRMFEIVFWLFTYTFMGLAAIVQIRTNTYPGTTPDIDPELHSTALLIVGLGCLAFGVGVLVAGARGPARPEPEPRTRISPYRLTVFTGFALLAAAYYVSALGIGTLFSSREGRTLVEEALWPNFTVNAIVRAAATLTLIIAFTGLMRLRRERRAAGGSGPRALPGVVLVALFVVVNPISSPRYVLGTALLAVAVALGAASTTARARVLMASFALALVVVFPYADFARTEAEKGPVKIGGPALAMLSADFDAFDQVNNTVAYVQDIGHTGGDQLAGAAFFWVPRAAWPDKPANTGELIADYRDYQTTNLSAPIWAEIWIDGGWPLLLVGMGAFGWLLRRADERAKAEPRALRPGILTGILPFYLIIVLRGSLLQAMAGLTVLVLSALFISTRTVSKPS